MQSQSRVRQQHTPQRGSCNSISVGGCASKQNYKASCSMSPSYGCQADGCKEKLSKCKPYCARYRVCPTHLVAPSVTVQDVVSRFCQQCAKFHRIEEFDGYKRSCRIQLARHNDSRKQRRREASLQASQQQAPAPSQEDANAPKQQQSDSSKKSSTSKRPATTTAVPSAASKVPAAGDADNPLCSAERQQQNSTQQQPAVNPVKAADADTNTAGAEQAASATSEQPKHPKQQQQVSSKKGTKLLKKQQQQTQETQQEPPSSSSANKTSRTHNSNDTSMSREPASPRARFQQSLQGCMSGSTEPNPAAAPAVATGLFSHIQTQCHERPVTGSVLTVKASGAPGTTTSASVVSGAAASTAEAKVLERCESAPGAQSALCKLTPVAAVPGISAEGTSKRTQSMSAVPSACVAQQEMYDAADLGAFGSIKATGAASLTAADLIDTAVLDDCHAGNIDQGLNLCCSSTDPAVAPKPLGHDNSSAAAAAGLGAAGAIAVSTAAGDPVAEVCSPAAASADNAQDELPAAIELEAAVGGAILGGCAPSVTARNGVASSTACAAVSTVALSPSGAGTAAAAAVPVSVGKAEAEQQSRSEVPPLSSISSCGDITHLQPPNNTAVQPNNIVSNCSHCTTAITTDIPGATQSRKRPWQPDKVATAGAAGTLPHVCVLAKQPSLPEQCMTLQQCDLAQEQLQQHSQHLQSFRSSQNRTALQDTEPQATAASIEAASGQQWPELAARSAAASGAALSLGARVVGAKRRSRACKQQDLSPAKQQDPEYQATILPSTGQLQAAHAVDSILLASQVFQHGHLEQTPDIGFATAMSPPATSDVNRVAGALMRGHRQEDLQRRPEHPTALLQQQMALPSGLSSKQAPALSVPAGDSTWQVGPVAHVCAGTAADDPANNDLQQQDQQSWLPQQHQQQQHHQHQQLVLMSRLATHSGPAKVTAVTAYRSYSWQALGTAVAANTTDFAGASAGQVGEMCTVPNIMQNLLNGPHNSLPWSALMDVRQAGQVSRGLTAASIAQMQGQPLTPAKASAEPPLNLGPFCTRVATDCRQDKLSMPGQGLSRVPSYKPPLQCVQHNMQEPAQLEVVSAASTAGGPVFNPLYSSHGGRLSAAAAAAAATAAATRQVAMPFSAASPSVPCTAGLTYTPAAHLQWNGHLGMQHQTSVAGTSPFAMSQPAVNDVFAAQQQASYTQQRKCAQLLSGSGKGIIDLYRQWTQDGDDLVLNQLLQTMITPMDV